MLADELDYVVGVDTHRDRHAVAVVDAHTGAVIAETTTAANARGYADAVRVANRHAPGDRLWAIEGTGHYGAGLARHLQRRGEAATAEAETLEREILSHVRALVPELLDEPGIGPIVAAQLMVSWSHRDRVRSEGAFARLAGVAPLPASSGQTIRHRLSRGGDRQLNRALHTVILHRRQHDPATRDYIARRVAEGKSARDATRILKRYLARHLYRVMQNAAPLTT